MSNINHNRPYLKNIDNIKREIAEIESWHKPDSVASKKSEATPTYGEGRKRSVSGMDKKIHLLACNILAHVQIHREVSLCNKLVNSLHGARKTALIEWFCEFGEVTAVDLKTKKPGSMLLFCKHRETKQIEAETKPFWESMPAIKMEAINLREEIMKIIIAAEKCLAKEIPCENDNVDPVLVSKLKSLVKTMPK